MLLHETNTLLDEVLTIQEISEIFGVHRNTVRSALLAGRIHGRQSGSTWIIPRREAEIEWADGKHRGKHRR